MVSVRAGTTVRAGRRRVAVPPTGPTISLDAMLQAAVEHPRMIDILSTVKRRLPHAKITLTTNGSVLTEPKLRQLTELDNVRYLWFSVNDHREAEYEATMKLPFERLLARLDMVARYQAEELLRFPVFLSRVGDDSAADDAFVAWCNTRYPGFKASIHPRGNWLGQVDTAVPDVPDVGCERWFELSITATGTVAHRCMDGEAQFSIGDVRERHVLEVDNAPEYRRLREHTLSRRDVSPCNGCTFL